MIIDRSSPTIINNCREYKLDIVLGKHSSPNNNSNECKRKTTDFISLPYHLNAHISFVLDTFSFKLKVSASHKAPRRIHSLL